MSGLILSNNQGPKLQVTKLINRSQVVRTLNQFGLVEWSDFTFYLLSEMTDMENLDNTEEQKKSGYAALREKHSQEMADLQAKLDAEIAGRAADKKLYFSNTMKSKGYEGDFDSFADKYSSLSIDDLSALYEGQHGKAVVTQTAPTDTTTTSEGPKSVIAGANPTTEVGGKKLSDMSTDELLNFAKTQSRYHN